MGADIVWQDIMAGYQVPNLGLEVEVEDWMNGVP